MKLSELSATARPEKLRLSDLEKGGTEPANTPLSQPTAGEPEETSLFGDLIQGMYPNTMAQMGASTEADKRKRNLERVRDQNPGLAQTIEETPWYEQYLIGGVDAVKGWGRDAANLLTMIGESIQTPELAQQSATMDAGYRQQPQEIAALESTSAPFAAGGVSAELGSMALPTVKQASEAIKSAPFLKSYAARGAKASKAVDDYFRQEALSVDNALNPPRAQIGITEKPSIPDQALELQQSQNAPRKPFFFGESAKKQDIRKAITEGDVTSAGWKINKSGSVVKDDLQRDLIKNYGVNENMLVNKNSMSMADKGEAVKMINIVENRIRKGSVADNVIPRVVIGNNAMKRVDVIRNAQDEARKRITHAVKVDLSGRPVDKASLINNFVDDLGNLGVEITEKGKLDFTNSQITGNLTPLREAYRLINTKTTDAAKLHQVKQSLDKLINYENPFKDPVDARAQGAIRSLRGQLNGKLRELSSQYAKANDTFAEATKGLEPFYKSMGKKFDVESTYVDAQAAQELRKLITNYNSALPMRKAIDTLDATARQFGGEFKDDIMTQVLINNELERTFGSFVPGNAQGVIEAGTEIGTKSALRKFGVAGDIAAGALDTAKDKFTWNPPSKEQLELVKKLKQYFSE